MKNIISYNVVVFFILFLLISARASDEVSQWNKFVSDIKSQSDHGDYRAMGILSSFLKGGIISERNIIKALELAKTSASNESPFGTYALARIYEEQKNKLANQLYEKGFSQLLQKAQDGDVIACIYIGNYYFFGTGIEKNPQEGIKWYQKAADQGYAPAEHQIAKCYFFGDGIETNPQKAIKWYQKAADQGFAPAERDLGIFYRDGTGIEKNPQEAIKWFQKAADQGFAPAQASIGICYKDGTGIEKNPQEAIKWFQKAADQGFAPAQAMIGECYLQGVGVPINIETAYKYLKKASIGDDVNAAESAQKLIDDNTQLSNEECNDINKSLVKSVVDPENEKYGGPNTLTVVKLGSNRCSMFGNCAIFMLAVQNQIKREEPLNTTIEIKRGEPLVATGGGGIPSGTKVFPLRFIFTSNQEQNSADVYFYKDPFGEWNWTKPK